MSKWIYTITIDYDKEKVTLESKFTINGKTNQSDKWEVSNSAMNEVLDLLEYLTSGEKRKGRIKIK